MSPDAADPRRPLITSDPREVIAWLDDADAALDAEIRDESAAIEQAAIDEMDEEDALMAEWRADGSFEEDR